MSAVFGPHGAFPCDQQASIVLPQKLPPVILFSGVRDLFQQVVTIVNVAGQAINGKSSFTPLPPIFCFPFLNCMYYLLTSGFGRHSCDFESILWQKLNILNQEILLKDIKQVNMVSYLYIAKNNFDDQVLQCKRWSSDFWVSSSTSFLVSSHLKIKGPERDA